MKGRMEGKMKKDQQRREVKGKEEKGRDEKGEIKRKGGEKRIC